MLTCCNVQYHWQKYISGTSTGRFESQAWGRWSRGMQLALSRKIARGCSKTPEQQSLLDTGAFLCYSKVVHELMHCYWVRLEISAHLLLMFISSHFKQIYCFYCNHYRGIARGAKGTLKMEGGTCKCLPIELHQKCNSLQVHLANKHLQYHCKYHSA